MEGRPTDSEEDPRAYANVFVRLGSPPPSRSRFEKLVAELRRRAVVLGERLRTESVALASRVCGRAGAALQRGREERAVLLERGRELRATLGRRAVETRVVLVGRIRQASAPQAPRPGPPTTAQTLECPIDPTRADCQSLCASAKYEWCP